LAARSQTNAHAQSIRLEFAAALGLLLPKERQEVAHERQGARP
jgi:hypothetical protein